MKEWVKPYLLRNLMDMFYKISKQPEELKRKWIEMKPKEFEEPESVFRDLTDFLQCDFGENLAFKEIFGSALADLPFEVFEKLCGMKNLFIIFNSTQGAEVKLFHLEKGIRKGQTMRIASFPYTSMFRPREAIRGMVVHEIAHVFLEHDFKKDGVQIEDKADQTARNWGFEAEIKALRDYWAELDRKKVVTYGLSNSTRKNGVI